MKIVHVISSIDNGFGVAEVVKGLSRNQVEAGHEVTIMSLSNRQIKNILPYNDWRFKREFASLPILSKLGCSRAMRDELLEGPLDLIHSHGMWMMPNIYAGVAAFRAGRLSVLSPHGMMAPDALRYSRSKKKLFWYFWQRAAVESVSCFHATANSEYQDIRRLGFRQPVAVIGNPIKLPEISNFVNKSTQNSMGSFILSLGRLHPIKGLDRLINAFASAAPDFPSWKLRIVGPDEGGYVYELKRQIAAANIQDRVTIEPGAYGMDKFRLMRSADLFVVPSLNENFGVTIAESLGVETPVISTKGTPWDGLITHRCGWWVDHGQEAMEQALRDAMSLSVERRREMGARGRNWIKSEFDEKIISEKMITFYRWLFGLVDRPDFVRFE